MGKGCPAMGRDDHMSQRVMCSYLSLSLLVSGRPDFLGQNSHIGTCLYVELKRLF